MSVPPHRGPERRKEPRFTATLPVTMLRSATARTAGNCLDLSNEGLLVELAAEADGAEGELVRVEFAPPDELPLIITAIIARRVGRLIGLRLFGMSGEPEQRWRALVTAIIRRHGRAG